MREFESIIQDIGENSREFGRLRENGAFKRTRKNSGGIWQESGFRIPKCISWFFRVRRKLFRALANTSSRLVVGSQKYSYPTKC